MASILKVDEMRGVTSAGDITITSEGGSATMQLQQGLAKAWAILEDANTGTPSLPDSFNTASFTDLGTGNFYVTWTNSFSSEDFATCNSGRNGSTDVGAYHSGQSSIRTQLLGRAYNSNSNTDFADNMASAFGDLA